MSLEVEHLDLEDLLGLAGLLLGEPVPVRDLGLLGAAAERPRASAFGQDAYPDTWTKAAALLQSLVESHPLVDGNKRLGWLATGTFLELNGVCVTSAGEDSVYRFVMEVAAGHHEVGAISTMLRQLIESE